MNRLKSLIGVFAISAVLFSSCSKDFKSANQTEISEAKKSTAALAPKLMDLAAMKASFPAGYEKRLQANAEALLSVHPEYRSIVENAISPTPCDANTPINLWLDNELADWNSTVIYYAIITGMLDFPTYDALLFENTSAGQYFGRDGEYSHILPKTFKDLKRFWNIYTGDMVLAAMHGKMLQNRDKLIRIDMILYDDPQPIAEYWADLILSLLDVFPQYDNGEHPIFTFNAFAQGGFSFPPYGNIPPKIIMGDGILEGYAGIGYEDIAPQAILAHEFGHQVQFQMGVFGSENTPEATRRTELMADAFSAYYLSHARGASMQWKRVKQFLQVFFNIGDCSFTSTGHHGTPTQRMAAAEWAYHLADNAQKQGHILTAQEFIALFEAELPHLVTQ